MQPKWFDAGAKDYGFPPLALLSLEFLLLGFLELKRYQGFKKTGKVCIASWHQKNGSFQANGRLRVSQVLSASRNAGCYSVAKSCYAASVCRCFAQSNRFMWSSGA